MIRGLLLLAALVLFVAAGLARLRVDNSPASFLGEDADLSAHVANYGADHTVRVVVFGGDAATRATWLSAADAAASAVPGVLEVVRSQRLRWLGQERLVAALALERPDASAMLVRFADAPSTDLRRTLTTLRRALPKSVDLELVVAGLPVLDAELDRASRAIALEQFPLLVLLAGGTLLWWMRPRRHLLAPLAVVATTVLLVFAGLGWLGVAIDLVVAVLLPLLFAIALATTLHVVVRWRAHAQRADRDAVAATYRDLSWSVLWSGVTTAIGFGSLTFASIAPVRHFGAAAAAGAAVLTLLVFTLLRSVLGHLGRDPVANTQHRRIEAALEGSARQLAAWACRRPGLVVAMALLLGLGAALGLPRLRVESDAMRYFPREHELRRDAARLESLGMALAAVQIVVPGPPQPVEQWRRFEEQIAGHDMVLGVAGPGSLSPQQDPLRLALAAAPFVAADASSSRAIVGVRLSGFEGLDRLRTYLREAARTTLGGRPIVITGTYPALLDAHKQLLRTLVWSLATTLGTIAVVLRILLGKTSTALAVLAPNVWPVVTVFGGMGWVGVPVDVATVMVGAIAVGIAVDDSLHIVGGLRHHETHPGIGPGIGLGISREGAVVETIGRAAPAFALTTLLLVLGFGVCATASFLPTQRFGLLAVAALLLALLADLVLLPALLVLGPRIGPAHQNQSEN